MLNFTKKNNNPKRKKTNDCTIRAITEASGKDYYEVYKDLYEMSVKTGFMINEKRCEDKVLEQYGFTKMKQPRKDDGTKYTVSELDKLIGKNDVAVVTIAGHITCVKNHTIIDLWNCGHKTIGNYYILNKTNDIKAGDKIMTDGCEVVFEVKEWDYYGDDEPVLCAFGGGYIYPLSELDLPEYKIIRRKQNDSKRNV